MNWKDSLDRYLTTPPDDKYDSWCEQVDNSFDDDFWNNNIDWVTGRECGLLYDELFNEGKSPQEAADIITEKISQL